MVWRLQRLVPVQGQPPTGAFLEVQLILDQRVGFIGPASRSSKGRARDVLATSNFRVGPIPDGHSAQWHSGPVLYLRSVDAVAARAEIEARIGAVNAWLASTSRALASEKPGEL